MMVYGFVGHTATPRVSRSVKRVSDRYRRRSGRGRLIVRIAGRLRVMFLNKRYRYGCRKAISQRAATRLRRHGALALRCDVRPRSSVSVSMPVAIVKNAYIVILHISSCGLSNNCVSELARMEFRVYIPL
ncbi:hypothetical protein EVAR_43910_1 [Eumeta japonica]|uniref:Uncharacterized protein n=1 Tax=Eumeta variegata TaxID=151549 RepID=A0A4C1WQV2_EUMVA|nr:hypothetical protein EVAR_43910_1 [Eumeta japonica]